MRGKRNGLIELYRFLFALNVVKSHSLLPYRGPHFSPGRISVEFFFVLSGYLLLRSIDKYRDMPFKKGFFAFLIAKVKPLLIPLIIAIPCNIAYSVVTKEPFPDIWGYLWYVEVMLVLFLITFVIRYFVRNERTFFIIILSVFAVAAVLHLVKPLYSWGYFRGAMSIPLGILLSYLPPLKLKRKWVIWLILTPVIAAVFCVYFFVLGNNIVVEEILDLVLYPALIYLSFQLNVSNPVFSYLGGLSFGLYAFQCPADLLRELGVSDVWVLFGVILILTLAEDGGKRIYRLIKAKKISTGYPV